MAIPPVSSGTNSSSPAESAGVGKSTIDVSDFLKLLSTQMSNQDVLNPTDNTQFISQMAQISSLQAIVQLTDTVSSELETMQLLSRQSAIQYGASLMGKTVTVTTADKDGNPQKIKGVVDSVDYGSDTYTISVDGKTYNLSSVTAVYK